MNATYSCYETYAYLRDAMPAEGEAIGSEPRLPSPYAQAYQPEVPAIPAQSGGARRRRAPVVCAQWCHRRARARFRPTTQGSSGSSRPPTRACASPTSRSPTPEARSPAHCPAWLTVAASRHATQPPGCADLPTTAAAPLAAAAHRQQGPPPPSPSPPPPASSPPPRCRRLFLPARSCAGSPSRPARAPMAAASSPSSPSAAVRALRPLFLASSTTARTRTQGRPTLYEQVHTRLFAGPAATAATAGASRAERHRLGRFRYKWSIQATSARCTM